MLSRVATKKVMTSTMNQYKNMQQELKLKSYQKDDKKVKIIQLTDLTFHTNGKRPTKKLVKKLNNLLKEIHLNDCTGH